MFFGGRWQWLEGAAHNCCLPSDTNVLGREGPFDTWVVIRVGAFAPPRHTGTGSARPRVLPSGHRARHSLRFAVYDMAWHTHHGMAEVCGCVRAYATSTHTHSHPLNFGGQCCGRVPVLRCFHAQLVQHNTRHLRREGVDLHLHGLIRTEGVRARASELITVLYNSHALCRPTTTRPAPKTGGGGGGGGGQLYVCNSNKHSVPRPCPLLG